MELTNQRMLDLIRHQRSELHAEGLITDKEYAELVVHGDSVARLVDYDTLQSNLDAQAALALRLREALEEILVDRRGCGCRPICRCNEGASLEVRMDVIKDTARAALALTPTEAEQRVREWKEKADKWDEQQKSMRCFICDQLMSDHNGDCPDPEDLESLRAARKEAEDAGK